MRDILQIAVHGEDAQTASDLVVVGFFTLWVLSEPVTTREALEETIQFARLKARIPKESALRVLRAFSRAHLEADGLLRFVDEMANLPW